MPTVILLSSSPPPTFARSPTPVNCSPASQSSNASLHSDSPGRKRFKTSVVSRDSFSASPNGARQVLAEKRKEVNKIVTPFGRHKFKPSPRKGTDQDAALVETEAFVLCGEQLQSFPGNLSPAQQKSGVAKTDYAQPTEDHDSPGIPLVVQRAVARRIDWTPPKPCIGLGTTCLNAEKPASFPQGLLGDFNYQNSRIQGVEEDVHHTPVAKRRKLSLSHDNTENGKSGANILSLKPKNLTASKKRNKSPPKKALTITALATSNYLDQENTSKSSTMQHLAATHTGVSDDTQFQNKVRQQEAAVKKLKASKKQVIDSRLVSPSSAMRSFEKQEAIFGSASQLARDLPNTRNVSRDDSDIFRFSDPLSSSPPRTQPVSVESTTPQLGTSRFRKSRNLWAAAGRDEDNALLHNDAIDLTESPTVRDAFIGKDVMVQPATYRKSAGLPGLTTTSLSCIKKSNVTIVDIDDVAVPTKSPSLQRTFCTSAQAAGTAAKGALTDVKAQQTAKVDLPTTNLSTGSGTTLKKPNHAGLSDFQLKKRISAYGFKAIKKREKMIELLDKCWDAEHASGHVSGLQEKPTTIYGDILSEVHAVCARPIPKKAKIPRARKKKDDAVGAVPAKKPRQRRKKNEEGGLPVKVTKPTRQRKTAASVKPTGVVYDIESLNESVAAGRDVPTGESETLGRPNANENAAAIPEKTCLPMPPLTCTDKQNTDSTSAKGVADADFPRTTDIDQILPTQSLSKDTVTPANVAPQPDLQDQITRAINHESFTSNVHLISPSKPSSSLSTSSKKTSPKRNHQTNPTWHEKILLYDPIILEDLAAWLNTTGLGNIGEDREVSALEVRSWCETRGICCLWKGGRRGVNGGE